jgi:excisionase family DNA binding protein
MLAGTPWSFLMSKRIMHPDRPSGDLFTPARNAVAGDGAEDHSNPEFFNSYAEASQPSEARRRSIPTDLKQKASVGSSKVYLDEKEATGCETASTATAAEVPEGTTRRKRPMEKRKARPSPSTSSITPRMMTVEDVAAYLSVSVSKIWRLRRNNAAFPKPKPIGKSTRWDRTDIDRYLDRLSTPRHVER